MSELFRVRQPQVTSSIVEGEAVIINLDTGNYYSTDGTGAQIWHLIQQGYSKADIVRAAQSGESVVDAKDLRAIDHFFDMLLGENLVEPAGESTEPKDVPSALLARPFEEPVLFRYDDMNELLLLDPIHDVDESGWPKTPTGQLVEGTPGEHTQ